MTNNTYTANAILSDNTIISVIVEVFDKINLIVTILDKGFYNSNNKYTKTIEKRDDIKNIINEEVSSIAKNLLYKITYNF